LALDEPKLNRWAVCSAVNAFLQSRADQSLSVPVKGEISTYLFRLIDEIGRDRAFTEFSYLQIAAARVWGAEQTVHFAAVLRGARAQEKAPRATEWDRAIVAIQSLPADWRAPMMQHLERSREKGKTARGVNRWSASHVAAVSRALATWGAFCEKNGCAALPSGMGFEAFGRFLRSSPEHDVSTSSVAHILSRVYSGFVTVLSPGFDSAACDFVLRDWRERGALDGTPIKTAAQNVSASATYEHGYELMERARCRRTRGVRAAVEFRNGILLATAIALPQRARALSALELGRTISFIDKDNLHIRIPGRWIKQREGKKEKGAFDRVMKNPKLAAALAEYARDFRPIFDEGSLLFPSSKSPMQGLTEGRLGMIAGELTLAAFNVRVSIHRFRDNVATEVSETMPHGGRLASAVLGHRDQATTARFYDHSEGYRAASEFGELIDLRRSEPVDLLI